MARVGVFNGVRPPGREKKQAAGQGGEFDEKKSFGAAGRDKTGHLAPGVDPGIGAAAAVDRHRMAAEAD